ncbi:uncharacterized protein ACLA_097290 [Aspergillus clavatus NRRL 1]|uniref:Uncharacterized protein n=1 Tax=Aspergillus clavatus (strain ATCC 1007 / CBS 513.65 / DSM 816 / NCTC 3887 / NRRL 1 / QM 1276 / 107) TaxID=344612 RepID=A1CMK4_ASPCL|nr:uncharacterized protein ACLA_097290 [Aspergillus clavatus NRRL 1]EAW08791.1 hypothetical protein ACLA_097290 [Aspergillus clavatus NRRL 1]
MLARFAPESLTVAVVMDSMDWFDPGEAAVAAAVQVGQLHRPNNKNEFSMLVIWPCK